MSSEADGQAVVAKAVSLGKLVGLVNCAGIAPAEKTVYIKKVELILNGAPLGNTCFPGNLIDYFYFEQMKLEIIFRSNRN